MKNDNINILELSPMSDEVEMTALGLKFTAGDINTENFHQLFASVISLSRASNWLLGDTLNLSVRKWGNKHSGSKYEEASKQTGLSVTTLRDIASVCRAIPFKRRQAELSFAHHSAVIRAADSDREQDQLLIEAKEEEMSSRKLRKHLLAIKQKKVRASMYEDSDENFDRPFGITDISDSDNMQVYPMHVEINRSSAWFSDRDLRKISARQRKAMLADLAPLFRDVYALFQLERKANPDLEFELPFEIKSLTECPPDFMKNQPIST